MTRINSLILKLPRGLRHLIRDLLPPLLTRWIDVYLHRGDMPRLPASLVPRWQALEDKLWGGFSTRALRDLETLKGDPASRTEDIADAARALAGWYASNGDAPAAYANALLARVVEPALGRRELHILLETDALLQTGQVELARRILTRSLQRHPTNSLCCAMANTCATPSESIPDKEASRLIWMNRPLEAAGLAPLIKIDPALPLSIENLTAQISPTAPRPSANAPRVTVIIPAYNAESTLHIAIRGLLEQTWTNLEIIVVDDVSPDRTYEVAQEFARKDARVIALRQETNMGAYAARNAALRIATGEFVTVHDADDWSHPQKIELQVRHLLDNPECKANLTDWIRCLPHLYFRGRPRAMLSWIHFNHSSLLMRRELLQAMGGWDDVRIAADSELIRRLEHDSGGRIPRVHQGVPLSLALVAHTSLTQQGATHARTLRHGVRRTYFEASVHWLSQQLGTVSVVGGPQRPFPAPPFILPVRGAARELDLLYLQDFSQSGAEFDLTLRDLQALRSSGKSVGIFHWPLYESDVAKPLPDGLWRAALEDGVAIVTPGEHLTARTVVCRTPTALEDEIDLLPKLRCDDFICTSTEPCPAPAKERIARLVRGHFAVEPSWRDAYSPLPNAPAS